MMVFPLNGLLILTNFFIQIKLSLSKDAELAIPNTTHPVCITVDASLIG